MKLVKDTEKTRGVLKAHNLFPAGQPVEERGSGRVCCGSALPFQAQSEKRPMRATIAAAVRTLSEEGCTAEELQALIDDLFIMPVFTAHFTEAKRRNSDAQAQAHDRVLASLDGVATSSLTTRGRDRRTHPGDRRSLCRPTRPATGGPPSSTKCARVVLLREHAV
ncbi:MAG: phosphoenolpyruvate carboxylase [Caldilineaceae bacterium]